MGDLATYTYDSRDRLLTATTYPDGTIPEGEPGHHDLRL